MTIRTRYLLYICSWLIVSLTFASAFGQTPTIDRLKKDVESARTPEEKRQTLLFLCDQGNSLHPDTLMYSAVRAKQLAEDHHHPGDQVKAMYYISFALTNKGMIDSSLAMADRCLDILRTSVNDPLLVLHVLNQRGRCFMRKNQYKDAIEMGYRVIAGAEKQNNVLLQMKGKTLIGWAYLEMGQSSEALKWHLNALNTSPDTLQRQRYSILYANLALNYNGLGKADSGFYYISRAIQYSRRNEDLFALSNSLAIYAQLLVRAEQAPLAEAPLKEVVEIRKLIGDPYYIVSDMAQLGLYYAHNGQPAKGIAICNEGIALARSYGIVAKLSFLYGTLAENYKVAGDSSAYVATLEKIITLKDSVYQNNSAVAIAELQTRYELEKKENTIIRQRFSIVKKNFFLYGSMALLFVATVAAWFLFRGYRRRQQLRITYMREEERRLSAQAIHQAEEKERQRIAADLHDSLGAYAASIASNIDNLVAVPGRDEAAMRELRNNAHDIVAQLSDSIWALKKESLSLTAISDRLKVFISRLRKSYPEIQMSVEEDISHDHLFPTSQAFHLYRILQEAISNALRHSRAFHIRILFTGNDSWSVTVADDGVGMSGNNGGSGYGLSNMKERSREAGWQITWTKPGTGGTIVEILPTTN